MLLPLHTDVGNFNRHPRLNPNHQCLPTVQNLLTLSLTQATSTHTGESGGLQVSQSQVHQILTVNDFLKPSAEVHRFRLTLSAFAQKDFGQNKESEKSHWYNFAEQGCQDWSCYHICRRTRSDPPLPETQPGQSLPPASGSSLGWPQGSQNIRTGDT